MDARRLLGVGAGLPLLVAVVLALVTQVADARVPDDLDLTKASEVWRRTEPVPNPHGNLPCEKCHLAGGISYKVARQFGVSIPLQTGEEISTPLCLQCHQQHAALHPVGFAVRRLADAVEKAGVFPLETRIETYNYLTCTSCHSVHYPHTSYRLLRGFAIDGRFENGPFRTRLDFCRACHGAEETLSFSGHRLPAGDTGCSLCHETGLETGSVGALKKDLNQACSFCHPPIAGESAHYAEYNPFPGMSPEVLAGGSFDMIQGGFTCATCHRHHRLRESVHYLTASFVAASAKSFQVNPHRTTRFCLNCHTVNPPPPGTPGAAAPLIDADVTSLCRKCHDREQALRMQHPLVAPSEDTPVPAGWPVRKDGALGCETCHLSGHGPPDPDNPHFLRSLPDQQRNGFCFRCHHDDRKRGQNLHGELAAGRGCDVCHEGPGSASQMTAGKAGALRAEPNLLCLLCHTAPKHPASAEHTLRPRPSSFLAIDHQKAPLTQGKITCHTCHDSHATDQKTLFLRTSGTGRAVCSNCHPY